MTSQREGSGTKGSEGADGLMTESPLSTFVPAVSRVLRNDKPGKRLWGKIKKEERKHPSQTSKQTTNVLH